MKERLLGLLVMVLTGAFGYFLLLSARDYSERSLYFALSAGGFLLCALLTAIGFYHLTGGNKKLRG